MIITTPLPLMEGKLLQKKRNGFFMTVLVYFIITLSSILMKQNFQDLLSVHSMSGAVSVLIFVVTSYFS